jgi:hypothetical protein
VTVQLGADRRWKLQARWASQRRAVSVPVSARREGDRFVLVHAGEVEAGVACGPRRPPPAANMV